MILDALHPVLVDYPSLGAVAAILLMGDPLLGYFSDKKLGRIRSVFIIHDQRCMIAKFDFLENLRLYCARRSRRRCNLIINPPADIFRIRLAAMAPPSILIGACVKPAKDIDITGLIEKPRQPGALLR